MKKNIIFFLAACLSSYAWAYDIQVDDLCYNITSVENKTCEVTYSYIDSTEISSYEGDVYIHDSFYFEGSKYTVTSIGEYAFANSPEITSVIIPSTIETIGDFAFQSSSVKEVVIPNTVTHIGAYAFRYCDNLSSIDLGASITTIEKKAFHKCSNLSTIVIPYTVSKIGIEAFTGTPWYDKYVSNSKNFYGNILYINDVAYTAQNRSIINCEFKESTISIGDAAFRDCTGLSKIRLTQNITVIGENAFENCTNLVKIYLPKDLTTIHDHAFSGCNALNKVYNYSRAPQKITETTFETYSNLFVVPGYEEVYSNAAFWNNFTIIGQAYDPLVENIILDKEIYYCGVGDTVKVSATILPDDACLKDIIWNVSDTTIVTFNASTSEFIGLKNGKVTLSATAADGSNANASATVYVGPILAESITLDKTSSMIMEGESFSLIATIMPLDTNNKSVTWSSSDNNVATVSTSGKVTGIKAGQAKITVTTNDGSNLSASCSVTVYNLTVSNIELSDQNVTIHNGEYYQLSTIISPENATNQAVEWTSSNNNVATVTQEGLVYAANIGSAVISVTTLDGSNLSAFCIINVEPTLVTSLEIIPSDIDIYLGETTNLEINVLPSNAYNKEVIWSSSDDNIVMISSTGKVMALAVGNAVVTAKAADGSGISASCNVNVLPILISNIELTPDYINIFVGDSYSFSVEIQPTNATNQELAWSSSNEEVALVSSTGKVFAISEGTTTITASALDGSGIQSSSTIVVEAQENGISNVTLSEKQFFASNGTLKITGVEDEVDIYLYNLSGIMISHAKTIDHQAEFNLTSYMGQTIIVNVEGKAVRLRI